MDGINEINDRYDALIDDSLHETPEFKQLDAVLQCIAGEAND